MFFYLLFSLWIYHQICIYFLSTLYAYVWKYFIGFKIWNNLATMIFHPIRFRLVVVEISLYKFPKINLQSIKQIVTIEICSNSVWFVLNKKIKVRNLKKEITLKEESLFNICINFIKVFKRAIIKLIILFRRLINLHLLLILSPNRFKRIKT